MNSDKTISILLTFSDKLHFRVLLKGSANLQCLAGEGTKRNLCVSSSSLARAVHSVGRMSWCCVFGLAPEVSMANDRHSKGKWAILSLVGGLEHCLFFHILGNSSSQLTSSYFSEGLVAQPPTSLSLPLTNL